MNTKYERYINYIVDDLISKTSVYLLRTPTGTWGRNEETGKMEFKTYEKIYHHFIFNPLGHMFKTFSFIMNPNENFHHYLKEYLKDNYGMEGDEFSYIAKKWYEKLQVEKDNLPVAN